MAAHQAPSSLGFSRQEHWSGLPFPSPMHESEKWKSEVAQSCLTLSDPMDCSLPGSSVHRIFQARVLEWVASAFSTQTLYLVSYIHSFPLPISCIWDPHSQSVGWPWSYTCTLCHKSPATRMTPPSRSHTWHHIPVFRVTPPSGETSPRYSGWPQLPEPVPGVPLP